MPKQKRSKSDSSQSIVLTACEGGVFTVGSQYGRLSCQNKTIYATLANAFWDILQYPRLICSATVLSDISTDGIYKAHIVMTKEEPKNGIRFVL